MRRKGGIYIQWRRRKTEKEENISRRKISCFREEKKNGEGKGETYLEKEREKHILRRKIYLFCVGERIRKRRKILVRGRRRTDKEEEENIQRKVMTDRQTYIQKFLF